MLHRFHGISLLTYVWCESSLGEGRVDMFSRHFFADVLCVSIRVSCGSRTARRFEGLLYFAVC